MKRSIKTWSLLGFAVTSLLGTLLHFVYDWTEESIFTAPFSAVNESTWEHMKLLFFPMLIFSLVESRFFREYENFWCIKLRSTLLGLALIPTIFYTYNGVIGKSPDFINISIFFIAAAISYIYEVRQFNKNSIVCKNPKYAFIILLIIGAVFIIFTFSTPRLAIFRDPTTLIYGIGK